jgi:YHS domain-containing protein
MKNLMLYGLLATCFAIGSCNLKGSSSKSTENMASEPKPVNIQLTDLASDKDLFCGMTLVKGAINDTANYQGKVYGFCSNECKTEFEKNPESHLSTK